MRIAVCDDNPKELERIKGCFCRIQGYDLVCSYFDSTSTVMEILKTENSPYDLYILDIEMPGMNGLKLAKSIREKDSRALFVFLTGQEGLHASAGTGRVVGDLGLRVGALEAGDPSFNSGLLREIGRAHV